MTMIIVIMKPMISFISVRNQDFIAICHTIGRLSMCPNLFAYGPRHVAEIMFIKLFLLNRNNNRLLSSLMASLLGGRLGNRSIRTIPTSFFYE